MKKIVITIEQASDGGVFMTMDPGAPQLLEDQLADKGTAAHTYALTAYRAIHDLAQREAAASGATVDAGEIPQQPH